MRKLLSGMGQQEGVVERWSRTKRVLNPALAYIPIASSALRNSMGGRGGAEAEATASQHTFTQYNRIINIISVIKNRNNNPFIFYPIIFSKYKCYIKIIFMSLVVSRNHTYVVHTYMYLNGLHRYK